MTNKVEVLFFGDTKDLQRSLRTLDQQFGNVEEQSTSMAERAIRSGDRLTRTLTPALAAAGVAAIKMASDQEQAYGALDSQLGEHADTVRGFGDTAADSYGLSREQVSRLGATTSAQLQAMGFAQDEAADKTVALQQRSADLAATFGGPVEQAVSAVSALLRGERDPIERYGVALKQADINARLAADGMDHLEGEERKLAEANAALAIFMEQTANAAGQFGREADTTAGQTARATAKAKDLTAELGEQLLPIATDVLGTVNNVADAFGRLPDPIKAGIVQAVLFGAALGPILSVGGRLVDTLTPLAKGFKTLYDAWSLGRSLAGQQTASLAAVGGAVAGVTIAVGLAVVAWQRHQRAQAESRARVEELTTTLDENTGAITERTRALTVQNLIDSGAADTARLLGISMELVTDAAMGNAAAQRQLATDAEAARRALDADRQAMIEADVTSIQLKQKTDDLTDAVARSTDEIERAKVEDEIYREGLEGKTETLDRSRTAHEELAVIQRAVTVATDAGAIAAEDHAVALGEEAAAAGDTRTEFEKLQDSLRAATDPVFAAIQAEDRYTEALAERNRISKDAEATTDDLREADIKVAEAFADRQGALAGLAQGMDDGTTSTDILAQAMAGLGDDAPQALQAILDAARNSMGDAIDAYGDLGENLALGTAAGIDTSAGAIADSLVSAVLDAKTAAQIAARMRSPSRLFAEEVGQPIPEGVAEGILEKANEPASAIQQVMEMAERQAKESLSNVISGAQATLGLQGAKDRLSDEEAELVGLRRGDLEEGETRKERAAKIAEQQRRVQEAQLALVQAQLRQIEAGRQLAEQGTAGGDDFVKAAIAAGLSAKQADALRRQLAGQAYLAGATFHEGGVVGPRGDRREVDIRALVGEEVLTGDDPRHSDNLARARSRPAGAGLDTTQVEIKRLLQRQTDLLEEQAAWYRRHRDDPTSPPAPVDVAWAVL